MASLSINVGLLELLKRAWNITPDTLPSVLLSMKTINEQYINQNYKNAEAYLLVLERVLEYLAGTGKPSKSWNPYSNCQLEGKLDILNKLKSIEQNLKVFTPFLTLLVRNKEP